MDEKYTEDAPQDTGAAAPDAQGEDTFFLPSDFPNAANLKAGDTISMTVKGVSDDGEVEVAVMGGDDEGGEKSLGDDLRASLATKE